MRTAMVTGPSSGIGTEVAKELARAGFHVVAAGRSESRVGAVVDEIRDAGGSAAYLNLDLSSLASVRSAVREFEASDALLDVLVNNAGVGIVRGQTADGFQVQFGVNHLGHFLLTALLGPRLRDRARVVTVASHMHYRSNGIDFDRVTRPAGLLRSVEAYATSKLANVLFTRELARRRPGLTTYAVHPGVVETGIFPAPVRPLVRKRSISAFEAADTIVWCATQPSPDLSSGSYLASREERRPSAVALDNRLAEELWERSDTWCGTGQVA